MGYRVIVLLASLALPVIARAAEPAVVVSEAITDRDGIRVHQVTCPYQAGSTRIRVLLPDPLDSSRKYPVIYVLPVEALDENHYGDGLLEIEHHDLQNRAGAIFVSPTFSALPWYADHPTDSLIRQETYFLKVVLPFVEKAYPARAEAQGRLLLGFSKSGWGAMSLLLRHPDLFGKAAAWDAPLMLDKPDRYGTEPIFGTQKQFEEYQVTRLLEKQAAQFRSGDRIFLLGYGNFRVQMQQAHDYMARLKISHIYVDGPKRSHDWNSGWVPEAVRMLLSHAEH